MMARYLLLLLLAQAACRAPLLVGADPYDEDEDDEDEELLVVGDLKSDADDRLDGLKDAGGDAPPPPTPTSDIEDPLKGITCIDAALNSPAIFLFPQRLNFGARA